MSSNVKNVGSIPANILFIDEKPNQNDLFVNKAISGDRLKLLNFIINSVLVNLKRHKSKINEITFYYTNIVNSDKEFSAKNAIKNHKNLIEIIKKVNPAVIIFVGKDTDKYSKNLHNKRKYKIMGLQSLIESNGKSSPYIGNVIQTLTKIIEENKFLIMKNKFLTITVKKKGK